MSHWLHRSLFIASLPCLVPLSIRALDLQWLLSHPEDILWLCSTRSGLTLSHLPLGPLNSRQFICLSFLLMVCISLMALAWLFIHHQHVVTFLQPYTDICCCLDEHCSSQLHCLHGNESVVDPAASQRVSCVAGSLLFQATWGCIRQLN